MNILGISRDLRFSPNMVSNDAAIFNAVAELISSGGHKVDCMGESDFVRRYSDGSLSRYDIVFDMIRSREATEALALYEKESGAMCYNTAQGIANCTRSRIARLFKDDNIPAPNGEELSLVMSDFKSAAKNQPYPVWLKRGEGSAETKEDVCFVNDDKEFIDACESFLSRGITEIVTSQHVRGDLVKFYGVEGTDFFDWDYNELSHSKFGLEKINGEPNKYSFSASLLADTANMAARTLGVTIYGGDCIIEPDGGIRIIDFNDWPSFSRCRKAAAEAIAERIIRGE